jgi:hypothetical protein
MNLKMPESCTCEKCQKRAEKGYPPMTSTRDVECIKCNELYHRVFDDSNRGYGCDTDVQQATDFTVDDRGFAHKFVIPGGEIYLLGGPESGWDCCKFRFGRKKHLTLQECPEWARKHVDGKGNVCNTCIKELLAAGEIRYLYDTCDFMEEFDVFSGSLCDSCDNVIEDIRYLIVEWTVEESGERKCFNVILDGKEYQTDKSFYCNGHYGSYGLAEGIEPQEWFKNRFVLCNKCFDDYKHNLVKLPMELCPDEYVVDDEESDNPEKSKEWMGQDVITRGPVFDDVIYE